MVKILRESATISVDVEFDVDVNGNVINVNEKELEEFKRKYGISSVEVVPYEDKPSKVKIKFDMKAGNLDNVQFLVYQRVGAIRLNKSSIIENIIKLFNIQTSKNDKITEDLTVEEIPPKPKKRRRKKKKGDVDEGGSD